MITSAQLILSLRQVCQQVPLFSAELNTLDGQLGDGDLGATLSKCAVQMNVALETLLPTSSPSEIFRAMAMACAQASGSSFGTLLAQAFMTAGKFSSSKTSLSVADTAELLHEIVTVLSQRGGAALGDKTVLDGLHALAMALERDGSHAGLPQLQQRLTETLDEFRPQPNRMGRARMFAERTIGLDDPGMVALLRLVEAL